MARNKQVCPEADAQGVTAYLGREGSTLQWEEVVKKKGKDGRVAEGTGEEMILLDLLWVQSVIASWTEIKHENQKIKMNQIQIPE